MEGGGRVQERSPALIKLPKPFRFSLIGLTHTEYDLTAAHLGIFLSVFTEEEIPATMAVYQGLLQEPTRTNIMQQQPHIKTILHRAMNNLHPHNPTGPLRNWTNAQGIRLTNRTLEILYEIQAVRTIAIRRLSQRGWHGDPGAVSHSNELWHCMAQGEAAVIRQTLMHLRHSKGWFSHGIVHDAVFIHNDISPDEFQRAFTTTIEELGVPHLHIRPKPWAPIADKMATRLAESGYNNSEKLDMRRVSDLSTACLQRPNTNTRDSFDDLTDNPRSIWDTLGVRPK